METTEEMYGRNGEVFEYKNMENLWSYVSHFLRPFYVYGYAFGELLTQSLYAVKDSYGDKFEPLYLDLLRAGGTKDAVELLAPFGLDPSDPEFWRKGMMASAGKWLDEAEALSKQLGIGVDASDGATLH
jgi:oligoendopeptidase F